MWKQSTIFGFIAGTLIALSLQALTAMGLFALKSTPKEADAVVGTGSPASGAAQTTEQVQEIVAAPIVAIGEHLNFSPFVFLSALLFFLSGTLFFILSNVSQHLNSELSSVIASSMTIEEKDELEKAVLKRHHRRLTALGVSAVLAALLAFAALLVRVT